MGLLMKSIKQCLYNLAEVKNAVPMHVQYQNGDILKPKDKN